MKGTEYIINVHADKESLLLIVTAACMQGLLQNGIVAVKRLSNNIELDEEGFQRELGSLMKVKHMNIVRFLGYSVVTHNRKY